MYWQYRDVIKTYGVRSRATIYKFAISLQRIAKRRLAAQSRAEARTRSRSNAGRWKIAMMSEEARRRIERGRREPERATARGRAQLTRALDKSECRRAARTFIARPRNHQPERRHVGRRARWLRKLQAPFKSLYYRPAFRFRARDKFRQIIGAKMHRE